MKVRSQAYTSQHEQWPTLSCSPCVYVLAHGGSQHLSWITLPCCRTLSNFARLSLFWLDRICCCYALTAWSAVGDISPNRTLLMILVTLQHCNVSQWCGWLAITLCSIYWQLSDLLREAEVSMHQHVCFPFRHLSVLLLHVICYSLRCNASCDSSVACKHRWIWFATESNKMILCSKQSLTSCCWQFELNFPANMYQHILNKTQGQFGVADAWKSFTDSVSEVFSQEPAKTPEATQPAQHTPSSKANVMPHVMHCWVVCLSFAQCCTRQLTQ